MAEKETHVDFGKGSNVQQSELEEITECCICSDKYNDQRILPCVHTFCLQCLQASASNSDKKPGDKMPCPVCREPFAIPRKGLPALKKNFFMSRLIELMKMPGLVPPPRGVDMNDQDDKRSDQAEAPPVTKHCTEDLYEGCNIDNAQRRYGRNQGVAAIGNHLTSDDTLKSPLLLDQCMQHNGEQMRLYCIDCDEVVCVLCFIDNHQSHKCNDVDKAADHFRHQLQKYVDILEDYEGDEMTKTESIADEKKSFLNDVSNVERSITGRSQQLKDLIDKHVASLLDDLTLIKQKRLKETDLELRELNRHRANLESFKKHCSEFKSIKSSTDVCRDFKNLQRRVDDVQKLHTPLIDRQMSLHGVSFTFTDAEDFLTTDVNSILGKIEGEVGFWTTFVVLQVGCET